VNDRTIAEAYRERAAAKQVTDMRCPGDILDRAGARCVGEATSAIGNSLRVRTVRPLSERVPTRKAKS